MEIDKNHVNDTFEESGLPKASEVWTPGAEEPPVKEAPRKRKPRATTVIMSKYERREAVEEYELGANRIKVKIHLETANDGVNIVYTLKTIVKYRTESARIQTKTKVATRMVPIKVSKKSEYMEFTNVFPYNKVGFTITFDPINTAITETKVYQDK